jgi:hypothetical protein
MAELTIWERFMRRNRRMLGEVTRLQVDLARESQRSSTPIVGRRSVSRTAMFSFWILVFLMAILGWLFVRMGR